MRTRLTALFLVVFALVSSVTSQTSTDPNEGLIFKHEATEGQFTLSWWGRSGKTYYVQHSSDLITWEWVLDASAVASGADNILQMSLQTNAKSGFFRLVITDNHALPAAWLASYGLTPGSVGSGPNDDPDGDGLNNFQEYVFGTNPNNADTDGDGFSDNEEQQNNTNPKDATDGPSPPAVRVQLAFVTNEVNASEESTSGPTDVTTWHATVETGSEPDDLGNGTDPDLDAATNAYQAALDNLNSSSLNVLGQQTPPTQTSNGQPFHWRIDYDVGNLENQSYTHHHIEGSRNDYQEDSEKGPAVAAYQMSLAALQNRVFSEHDVRYINGHPPTQTAEGQPWLWSINYEVKETTTTTTTTTDYTYNASRWNVSASTTALLGSDDIKDLIHQQTDATLDITTHLNAGLGTLNSESARDPQGSQAVYFEHDSISSPNVGASASWSEFNGQGEDAGKSARLPVGRARSVWLERVKTGIKKFDDEPLSASLVRVKNETSGSATAASESPNVVIETLTILGGHQVSTLGGIGGLLQLLVTPPTDHTATGTDMVSTIELEVVIPQPHTENGKTNIGSKTTQITSENITLSSAEKFSDTDLKKGGYVSVNLDDDDQDGDSSGDGDIQSDAKDESVENDDDLIQLKLNRIDLPGAKFKLQFADMNIKLWKMSNKTEVVTSDSTEFDANVDTTVYLEGHKADAGEEGTLIQMLLVVNGQTTPNLDKVRIHVTHPIVVAIGAAPNPQDEIDDIKEYLKANAIDKRNSPYFLKGKREGKSVGYSVWLCQDDADYTNTALMIKAGLCAEKAHVILSGHSNFGIGLALKEGLTDVNQFFQMAGGGYAGADLLYIRDHQNQPGLNVQNIAGTPQTLDNYQIQSTGSVIAPAAGPNINGAERYPNKQIVANATVIPKVYPKEDANPAHANHSFHLHSDVPRNWHYWPINEAQATDVCTLLPASRDVDRYKSKYRYASVFLNCCNSCRYYTESFPHGVLVASTHEIGNITLSRRYTQDIIEDSGWLKLLQDLNINEPNPNSPNIPSFTATQFGN